MFGVVHYFEDSLILSTLTLQTSIFGILDYTSNDYIFRTNKVFISHIMLIFREKNINKLGKKNRKYRQSDR